MWRRRGKEEEKEREVWGRKKRKGVRREIERGRERGGGRKKRKGERREREREVGEEKKRKGREESLT